MKRFIPLALVLGLALTSTGCGDDEKSPCEAACDAAAKAGCPNDDAKSVCVADCKDFYNTTPCQAEARAIVKCAAKETWTCDVDGFSQFEGCVAQSTAYSNCLD